MEWYLVKTRRNKERQVAALLEGWGIEVYLPLVRQRRRDGDTMLPYLWCYLFARFDVAAEALLQIRSAPGVDHLVAVDGAPVVVPDALVDELRATLAARNGDAVEEASACARWTFQTLTRKLRTLRTGSRGVPFEWPASQRAGPVDTKERG